MKELLNDQIIMQAQLNKPIALLFPSLLAIDQHL